MFGHYSVLGDGQYITGLVACIFPVGRECEGTHALPAKGRKCSSGCCGALRAPDCESDALTTQPGSLL